MMTDLVGDHIGLRKLTSFASDVAGSKAPLEVLEEARVEIDFLVERTVKRPHGGLCEPTGRLGRARKHDQRRRLVSFAGLGEDVFPFDIGTTKNSGYEVAHLIGRRAGRA